MKEKNETTDYPSLSFAALTTPLMGGKVQIKNETQVPIMFGARRAPDQITMAPTLIKPLSTHTLDTDEQIFIKIAIVFQKLTPRNYRGVYSKGGCIIR